MNLEERNEIKKILDNIKLHSYAPNEIKLATIKTLNEKALQFLPTNLYRYRYFNECSTRDLRTYTISSSNPKSFEDENDSLIYLDEENFINTICNRANRIPLQNWIRKNQNLFIGLNKEEKIRLKLLMNDDHLNYSIFLSFLRPNLKKALPYLVNEAKIYLKKDPHIVCLTDDLYSNKMWKEYGDNYRGFIIEYQYKKYVSPCLNCQNKTCNIKHYEVIFPIVYTDEKFDGRSFLAKYLINTYGNKYPFVKHAPIDDELAFFKILLYKKMKFIYESEWRIISVCNEKPAIKLKPNAIYAGKDITDENFNWLKSYCATSNIELYKMEDDAKQINYTKIDL